MIDLFKAFTTKDDFFYDGAFIAKVKYERFEAKIDKEIYKNKVVKSNRRLCILNCSGYVDNKIIETLTVYLMMNVQVKNPIEPKIIEDAGTLWHNFSKEEITDFSHTTGDTNSIHLTENPVVQGLLILKKLCETLKTNDIEVKYIHPVYGDNPVYIKHEKNIIKGFSNGILCFQGTLL